VTLRFIEVAINKFKVVLSSSYSKLLIFHSSL